MFSRSLNLQTWSGSLGHTCAQDELQRDFQRMGEIEHVLMVMGMSVG